MNTSTSKRDAITDVPGLRVGHWTDRQAATGCTVVMCPPEGAVAACAVLGGAPGTRETDALAPGNLVQRAHAILLTGGSAFGLDAASGVMRWLGEHGIGYELRYARVPIVPAAVIYDLSIGRADVRPDADAGYAACEAARVSVRRGSVGAGAGATVAKLARPGRAVKGGIGTASERLADGTVVGAIVAVNAVGEIVDPISGRVIAPVHTADGTRTDAVEYLRHRRVEPPAVMENTTVAVVATDLLLDRAQLLRVAYMAHTGIARAIRPSHTPADGDTIFALSTGTREAEPVDLLALGALTARALERAIVDGVRSATSVAGVPAVRTARAHVRVRPIEGADRPWIDRLIEREFGAPVVVARGVVYRPSDLDGFTAVSARVKSGLVTLRVAGDACEVVTLNSLLPEAGIGTALMDAAEAYGRARGCRHLWLVTTNDNTNALRFYQRRGMRIVALRPGAIEEARRLKPEIPLISGDGIEIRDEIELVKEL